MPLNSNHQQLCIYIFLEFRRLCRQATRRRSHAFRPGTSRNHITMITKWITFALQYNIQHVDPSEDSVCAYMETLARQFRSPKSISNYISAIRLMHKFLGVVPTALDSFQVTLMARAIKLTMREIPNRRPPVTTMMLIKLCQLCHHQGLIGLVIKTALLLSFYGFFRGSNSCPPTARQFDCTRHFTRGDIAIAPPGLVVNVKWSKTLQSANQPLRIPIPEIQHPALNIVSAYKDMIRLIPTNHNSALFTLPNKEPLTLKQFRKAFKLLLTQAGYTDCFSLHSLRRGGASESFASGAEYLDIQRQGGWSSMCFLDYITRIQPQQSTVCSALTCAAQNAHTGGPQ